MYSNPRSARNMYTKSMNQPPSFDPEPFRPCSRSRRSLLNVDSPERLGASMRSTRSMDPPISFSSDSCQRTKSMDSPPSFSEEENLDSSQTFHGYGRVDSTESYGLSMMRNNRSMEPTISFRVPLGPDSLDPGPEPVSQPEPDFTADISVKHLPLGYIEPPPSFKAEPIPRCSQSYSYKMSTERLDASMRRHRFMDPPTSSSFDNCYESMDPPPSFSGQQNPEFDTHQSNESIKPPQNQERNFWLGFFRLVKRITLR